MKSETWIRNFLKESERFVHEKQIPELTREQLREAEKEGRLIDISFILSVLYTGRNDALRRVLEIDGKQKKKSTKRKKKMSGPRAA